MFPFMKVDSLITTPEKGVPACLPHMNSLLIAPGLHAHSTSMLFQERLQEDVQKKVAESVKVQVTAPPERRVSAWIGGSILSSLDQFQVLHTHTSASLRVPFVDSKPGCSGNVDNT